MRSKRIEAIENIEHSNNCVIMYMYRLKTSDRRRQLLWERLFGSETLPIVTPVPRWQEMRAGEAAVLAYDLDVTRLHEGAITRLADYISQKERIPHTAARASAYRYPLRAAQCAVIQEQQGHHMGGVDPTSQLRIDI
jgi:hypothetical protein